MNDFRFLADQDNVDSNISIQSVGGNKDDLLDDEDQQVNQSEEHETQETDNLHSSHWDHIQLTTSTVLVLHKSTTSGRILERR